MMWFSYLLFILLITCPTPDRSNYIGQTKAGVSITYTGNMGVLISNDKISVWIDGPHQYYGPEYLNPPDTIINKALAKKGIFNHLQWLLFTHYHRDHFSTTLVNRFLQLPDNIKVAGAPQVIDSFSARNVINAWNRNGEILNDNLSSIRLKAFNIPHTWPQRHSKVQNIAYLAEINGIHIFHVGDADPEPDAFASLPIDYVDIAIVPAWFTTNEKGKKILEQMRVKKIIVTHIAPGENFKSSFTIKNADVILFNTINQTFFF